MALALEPKAASWSAKPIMEFGDQLIGGSPP